jgi:truncated hemoglobin YjbI
MFLPLLLNGLPRNPHLLQVLVAQSWAEGRGRGFKTVLSEFRKYGLKLPEILYLEAQGVVKVIIERPNSEENQQTKQEQEQGRDRQRRLESIRIDRSSFVQDRLASFVGREKELAEIKELISAKREIGGYITITGQAGQGKSSVIAKLVQEYGIEQTPAHFIPFNPGPDYQVSLLRDLMARLILKYNLSDIYVASENRQALRDFFFNMLRDIVAKGQQEIIFVDGLDQLEYDLNGYRDLSFLPDHPPKGILFVVGTRPDDTLAPLELLNSSQQYRLPNLTRGDFELILVHRGVRLEIELVDRFYGAMQENALYLDLVAKELAEIANQTATNIQELIGKISRNPDNIFSLSIERLKRQKEEWWEVLKPVLGLLLVAQEPMRKSTIRRILKIDEQRLRDGLRKLAGLVATDSEDRYYLYHLKLYDYLRQDLKHEYKEYVFDVEAEKEWHQKVVAWCEQGELVNIWDTDITTSANNQSNVNTPDNYGIEEQDRREYARQYYVSHLYYAQDYAKLWRVLDEYSYGLAKLRYDPTMRRYAQDLDLGRRSTIWEGMGNAEVVSMLPRLWYYSLLRCSLASQVDNYPEELFGLIASLGQSQEAIGLADMLTDKLKKIRILGQVSGILRKQGRTPQQEYAADLVLMRVYSLISELEGRELSGKVLTELVVINDLTKPEFVDRLREIISRVSDEATKTKVLAKLGQTLYEVGEQARASEVLQEAEQVARSIESNWAKASTLSVLGQTLYEVGEQARASEVLQEAEQVAQSIESNWAKASALSGLVRALGTTEKWEQAAKVIQTIRDSWYRLEALNVLGQTLYEVGEQARASEVLQEAEQVAQSIESNWAKASALSVLGQTLYEVGEQARASEVLQEAEQVAQSIESSEDRALVLRELAVGLAKVKQWKQVEWEQAEMVVQSIEDRVVRASAMGVLGQTLQADEEQDRANKVVQAFDGMPQTGENSDTRKSALRELVENLAETEQWEQALKIIRSIKTSDEEKTNILNLLINILSQNSPQNILIIENLIQQSWLEATTRDYLLDLLPMVNPLIKDHPHLALAFAEGIHKVDAFLKSI